MFGLITTLLGPVTGLVGSAVTSWFKEREAKAALEAKKLDQAHELVLLDKHAAIRGVEMENERAIAEVDAMARGVAASYQHDMASAGKSYAWAEAIKTLTRPVLTLLLIALSAAIYFTIDPLVSSINDMQQHIVYSVLFLTEVAVTWWFADRARASSRTIRS